MRNVYYILALAALHFSAPTHAQGCADIEPNDPYCFLPLYQDQEFTATFDDLATQSVIEDYKDVSWGGLVTATNKTHDQIVPRSVAKYAHANSGAFVVSATTDYMYLINLYFGCSHAGPNSTQVAQACTLHVQGTCLPVGFPAYQGGQMAQLNWTFQYNPSTFNSSLAFASPYNSKTTFGHSSKTNHSVLCTNYTISATSKSNIKPSLFIDDATVATYTYTYL